MFSKKREREGLKLRFVSVEFEIASSLSTVKFESATAFEKLETI